MGAMAITFFLCWSILFLAMFGLIYSSRLRSMALSAEESQDVYENVMLEGEKINDQYMLSQCNSVYYIDKLICLHRFCNEIMSINDSMPRIYISF